MYKKKSEFINFNNQQLLFKEEYKNNKIAGEFFKSLKVIPGLKIQYADNKIWNISIDTDAFYKLEDLKDDLLIIESLIFDGKETVHIDFLKKHSDYGDTIPGMNFPDKHVIFTSRDKFCKLRKDYERNNFKILENFKIPTHVSNNTYYTSNNNITDSPYGVIYSDISQSSINTEITHKEGITEDAIKIILDNLENLDYSKNELIFGIYEKFKQEINKSTDKGNVLEKFKKNLMSIQSLSANPLVADMISQIQLLF